MNYGLYLSASGVLTNLYRQDVYANNLANVETTGYKPDVPMVRQRDPESIEDHLSFDVSQRLLDRLGGGVLAGPQQVNYMPGALERTSNPMDLALTDKRGFFSVEFRDPQTGKSEVRLTRDGRFTRNSEGELVTQQGHRVLDIGDMAILLPDDGPVQINPSGDVYQNNELVTRIQVSRVQDTSQLIKQGHGLFAYGEKDPRELVENPNIKQGYIEGSGVDSIMALMRLVDATKAVTTNANMIRYNDLLMDRAVNTLGRVA